jgi:hypothetical protein
MEATNVPQPGTVEHEYNSSSEVFAYASKLVQNDLAAAVRIFRTPMNEPAVNNQSELQPA